jgi:hypothetical protein
MTDGLICPNTSRTESSTMQSRHLPPSASSRSGAGPLIGRMDAQFETLQLHMDAMQRNMDAMRREMRRDMDAMRGELHGDLARHTSAIFESTQAMIRALDERSTDVPIGPAGTRHAARDAEPR